MVDDRWSKIFNMGWKDESCKSCGGGGGDPKWWVVLLLVLSLTGVGWVLMASGWLAARGIGITNTQCTWDTKTKSYVAMFTVRNDEDVFKIVSIHVQGRFHPPAGKRWPHPAIRRDYEATSQQRTLTLEPRNTTEEHMSFSVPGTEQFLCTAVISIGWQERFPERPGRDVIDALASRRGSHSMMGFRRFR